MKNYCLQLTQSDCGFACLKMLLAEKRKRKEYLSLEEDLTKDEYSMQELKEHARSFAMELTGIEVASLGEIPSFPAIGLIRKKGKYHYVVVEKLNGKFVWYCDPAEGRRKAERLLYESISQRKYLVVETAEKTPPPAIRKFPVFLGYRAATFVNTLVQLICIFLLSFSVGAGNWLIAVSVSVFLLSIGLHPMIRKRYLKRYDERMLLPLLKLCKDRKTPQIEAGIQNEFMLKKDGFLYRNSMFGAALILGFLGFILMVNDLLCASGILLVSAYAFFRRRMIFERTEPLKQTISLLEDDWHDATAYKTANSLAYRIATYVQGTDLVGLCIIVLFSFLLCLIRGSYAQFLIVVLLLKIFMEKLDELLQIQEKKHEVAREICYHYSFESYLRGLSEEDPHSQEEEEE